MPDKSVRVKMRSMTVIAVECTCRPGARYADGSEPIFFHDQREAAVAWTRGRARSREGYARVQSELVVDAPHAPSDNGREVRSRREPLPKLRDYRLYFGVHLRGAHILAVKR